MAHEAGHIDFSDAFSGIDSKYLKFAPKYDDYKEKYISGEYDLKGEEYGLAGEIFGMARDRSAFEQSERDRGRQSAQDTLGLSLRGMGQQMSGTLASTQESAYNIFNQGEQVASGGLGTRSGLTSRSMKGLESNTERTLTSQAMSGIGAKSQYEDSLASLSGQALSSAQSLQQAGISYDAAGISYERAGMQMDRQMEDLTKDYEKEMYDYLLMLGQNFDIWGQGGAIDAGSYDDRGNWSEPGEEGITGFTPEELAEARGGNKVIGGGP